MDAGYVPTHSSPQKPQEDGTSICSRAGQNGPAEAPVTAIGNVGDHHGYLEAGSSDSWRQSRRRWPGNLSG